MYKIKMTKSGLFIFSKQRFFKKDFFSPKKLNKLCMLQRILILGILKLLTWFIQFWTCPLYLWMWHSVAESCFTFYPMDDIFDSLNKLIHRSMGIQVKSFFFYICFVKNNKCWIHVLCIESLKKKKLSYKRQIG